ncbi:FadR/GntR family transcriptional regulator [Peptoniphilus catoniae]|uniref:FadR/GntR family transcriptional regulator n=1 Tax=Peptoniphilus catoniae TaxID=1660341 RepID=UPI0010FD443B|nr:FCD domain-containing protein [Peptoniphilus catoniae]
MKEIKQQPKITDLILTEFVNSLKEGEMKVGEILDSERDLAKQLNVSRSSLREAFSILEFLGVISSDGNRKIVQKDYNSIKSLLMLINKDEIKKENIIYDYITFRKLIEFNNIKYACINKTNEDLKILWDLYDQIMKSDADYPDIDYKFHMTIAKSTHNVFFELVLEFLIGLIGEIRSPLIKYPGRLENIRKEYFEIISGIEQSDYERSEKAMGDHLFFIEATLKAFDEFKNMGQK